MHESEQRRRLSLPAARAAPPASPRPFPQPDPSPRSPSSSASLCCEARAASGNNRYFIREVHESLLYAFLNMISSSQGEDVGEKLVAMPPPRAGSPFAHSHSHLPRSKG